MHVSSSAYDMKAEMSRTTAQRTEEEAKLAELVVSLEEAGQRLRQVRGNAFTYFITYLSTYFSQRLCLLYLVDLLHNLIR
jgi:hypothetical protein